MRLLDDPAERRARARLLHAAHARPLASYAAFLRDARAAHVPDIDPLDGGTEARALLLLETPGPSIRGTGPTLGETGAATGDARFVSRDNPTPTARNIRRFAAEAGLARTDTVIWNTVPWTIHAAGARNRAPTAAEIRAGLALLPGFLALLPRLRCAILAGRVAGLARSIVGVEAIAVPHPSPTIVCTDPLVARRIRDGFARAAERIGSAAAASGGDAPFSAPE